MSQNGNFQLGRFIFIQDVTRLPVPPDYAMNSDLINSLSGKSVDELEERPEYKNLPREIKKHLVIVKIEKVACD